MNPKCASFAAASAASTPPLTHSARDSGRPSRQLPLLPAIQRPPLPKRSHCCQQPRGSVPATSDSPDTGVGGVGDGGGGGGRAEGDGGGRSAGCAPPEIAGGTGLGPAKRTNSVRDDGGRLGPGSAR